MIICFKVATVREGALMSIERMFIHRAYFLGLSLVCV